MFPCTFGKYLSFFLKIGLFFWIYQKIELSLQQIK